MDNVDDKNRYKSSRENPCALCYFRNASVPQEKNPNMLNHPLDNHRIQDKRVWIALVISLVVAFLILSFGNMRVTAAQSEAQGIRELFLRMITMRETNPDFVFGVEFAVPLGSEEVWLIGSANDDLRRSIDEVGDDYVCFREHHDAFQFVRCTPFSNIAEISYMDE